MAEKTSPCGRAENLVKTNGIPAFGPQGGGKKRTNLTVRRKPSKPLVKQCFGQEHRMARKKQARGRRRRTMDTAGRHSKALGKQMFSAGARWDPLQTKRPGRVKAMALNRCSWSIRQ